MESLQPSPQLSPFPWREQTHSVPQHCVGVYVYMCVYIFSSLCFHTSDSIWSTVLYPLYFLPFLEANFLSFHKELFPFLWLRSVLKYFHLIHIQPAVALCTVLNTVGDDRSFSHGLCPHEVTVWFGNKKNRKYLEGFRWAISPVDPSSFVRLGFGG